MMMEERLSKERSLKSQQIKEPWENRYILRWIKPYSYLEARNSRDKLLPKKMDEVMMQPTDVPDQKIGSRTTQSAGRSKKEIQVER